MNNLTPFHLAIPVSNLEKAKTFYHDLLGCEIGRTSDRWIDFNFFGHQFVTHLAEDYDVVQANNPVDGHGVPVPHFGVVLEWGHWHSFADYLKENNVDFILEPMTRFKEKRGEQATMFFSDPFGNALEFKSFKDMSQLFAV